MSTAWRLASAVALVLAVDQLVGTAHGRTLTVAAPAPGPDAAAVNTTAVGTDASTGGASYITIEQFPPPSTAYRYAASSYPRQRSSPVPYALAARALAADSGSGAACRT